MQGRLEHHTLRARALEGNPLGDPAERRLTVYVPPGYAADGARLPAVYFLHAFGNSGLSWTSHTGFSPSVPERLDALVASGAVPPVLGVFPDAWTALGGTQWMNSAAVGRYGDYLVQDVVPHVDRAYRTLARAEARAVVGHSSGGYGALVMGREHPDVFGHLSAQSADSYFEYCYLPDLPRAASALLKAGGVTAWWEDFRRRTRETKARGDDFPVINVLAMAAFYSPRAGEPLGLELPFEPETARLRPEVWSRWLAHDPVRFVPERLERFRQLKGVFIDCGTRDEHGLRWGARMVAQALREAGVEVQHEEFDDGHSGVSYRFERSLGYLVPRLARG